MSFLYLENGVVGITQEGMTLPAVQELWSRDRTSSKKFFADVITYCFYVYKKDGVYSDMFEDMRKKLVIERHLPGRSAEDIESNLRVVAFIEEYRQRQHTKLERFYYRLEKDMEALLEQISNIPYTRRIKHEFTYVNEDGVEIKQKAMIDVENYEEKTKAIKTAETLVDYGEKLKSKILKENMSKKLNPERRLFDKKK